MDIKQLTKELDQADNIKKLSASFDKITKAFNKSCDKFYKTLLDYKLSNYLYIEYVKKNKTKVEISQQLGIPPSSIYYYILKYNLKKDADAINKKRLESLEKVCYEKYGVNHPGRLPEAHRKRINNILYKSKGDYSKQFYDKLNRSEETIKKMKKSQQQRRLNEKLGDNSDEQ